MDKEVNDAYVAMTLKNVYEKTNDEITLDAMANRALAEKITSETINQKVNSQMSAISVGIRNINPRYTEKSKNYDITKSAILNSLTNYEAALVELSEFYDKKIEQLILRKVELEASLLGSIIRDEYLYKKENKKLDQKENDKVKKKISSAFKGMVEKLTVKKQDKVTDISLIHDAMDIGDIKTEIDRQLENNVEKAKLEEKENKENIQKEIRAINSEIKRINERKKINILNAMEVGDKWIATNIKRPKTFTKITRFFSSRFNTTKMINKTILEPLNCRINDFVNNELANVKG